MAEPLDPKKLAKSEQSTDQPTSMNKITPHKGGRSETRLVQMTPRTKRMLDEVLRLLTEAEGKRVSFSDWLETRIEIVYNHLLREASQPPDKVTPGTGVYPNKPTLPVEQMIQMSDEVKDLTDYVLSELRRRTGRTDFDLSEIWEERIRYMDRWLHDNPEVPPEYMGDIRTRTGKTGMLPPLPPLPTGSRGQHDGDGH